MPLPDLLWACPACGLDRGLEEQREHSRCRGCGARFRRAGGATIERIGADGETIARTPAEWVDRLPDPAALLERAPAEGPIRRARVEARGATGEGVVRDRGGYLNRYEILGGPTEGELVLRSDEIALETAPEAARGAEPAPDPLRWSFGELTAVQASSSALQIKARGRPLHSFRFHDDSIYLWELLVRAALQAFYRRTGRGEIVEFQPRIETARR